jgi:flagellar protein FlgJ
MPSAGGNLDALRRQAAADPDAALPEVARQFEALLTAQMLSAMRAVSLGPDDAGKHAETWRAMMDGELAQALSHSGRGLGLAEQLVAQLKRGGIQDATATADKAGMKLPEHRIEARRAAAAGTASALDAGGVDNPRNFVERIRPHAEAAAAELGVPLRAVVAHAALESGWGAHAPGDNFFGIKADSRWQGGASTRATLEYEGGALQPRHERFRDYDGPARAFGDYVDFLRANPRYAGALASSDGEAFLRGLAEAGYATDPDYADKLSRVYRSPLLDAALETAPVRREQTL